MWWQCPLIQEEMLQKSQPWELPLTRIIQQGVSGELKCGLGSGWERDWTSIIEVLLNS